MIMYPSLHRVVGPCAWVCSRCQRQPVREVVDDYSMIIICFRMLQNASKCFKMLQTASKCFNTPWRSCPGLACAIDRIRTTVATISFQI